MRRIEKLSICLLLLLSEIFLFACNKNNNNSNKNQKIENDSKSYILIEGAMDGENVYLLNELENKEKKIKEGFTYYVGSLEDKNVIILKTNVGEINAALSTKCILDSYKVNGIISQGTIGGYKKFMEIGDIIIADKIYNKDAYIIKIADNGEPYLNFESYTDENYGVYEYFESDKNLINKVKNIEYENGKIYVGNITSGDSWYDDKNIIEKYSEEYDLYGEEMESYGAFLIAKKYNVPFISARVVSNIIYSDVPYTTHVSEKEVNFVKRLLNIKWTDD